MERLKTVLLAEADERVRHFIAERLRNEDYLVLEAHNGASIFNWVVSHSRSIDLLVIGKGISDSSWIERLKPYCPETEILLIQSVGHQDASDETLAETVVTKMREMLRGKKASGGNEA
jgi:DNA-binding NtrC family response regulator